MREKLVVHGLNRDCKRVRVTLCFERGVLKNPVSLARSSMVGWGPWQSSRHLRSGLGWVWWVSTAGHGGYILVTQERPSGLRSKGGAPQPPNWHIESAAGSVYVYEFEEDCAWAVLEYLDNGVLEWSAQECGQDPHVRREQVVASLRRWHPQYLS